MTVAIHAAKRVPPIDYTGIRDIFKGNVSAICRSANECNELVAWFGSPTFCPLLPVMVMVPGADAPTIIAGFGYATTAELQDCALVTWHQQVDTLARQGKILDFDARR